MSSGIIVVWCLTLIRSVPIFTVAMAAVSVSLKLQLTVSQRAYVCGREPLPALPLSPTAAFRYLI